MDIRNFKSDDADFFSASRTLRKHFENMLADFINFQPRLAFSPSVFCVL